MINIPLDESNTVESPTTFGSHLEEAENTNDMIDSPLPIQEGAQTFSHGDNKRIHTWTDVLEHLRQKLHESLLQHQQRALRDGCVDIQTNEEANGQVQDEYIFVQRETPSVCRFIIVSIFFMSCGCTFMTMILYLALLYGG